LLWAYSLVFGTRCINNRIESSTVVVVKSFKKLFYPVVWRLGGVVGSQV